MIPTMKTWTPSADALLIKGAESGQSLREISLRLRKETRRDVHPTTCMRRLRRLGYTRTPEGWALSPVYSSRQGPKMRKKAPRSERLAPPGILILSVPIASSDEDVQELLRALPAGWLHDFADVEDTRADAIACARHQAMFRGETLTVLEDTPGQRAVVSIRRPGERLGSVKTLYVVRFARD